MLSRQSVRERLLKAIIDLWVERFRFLERVRKEERQRDEDRKQSFDALKSSRRTRKHEVQQHFRSLRDKRQASRIALETEYQSRLAPLVSEELAWLEWLAEKRRTAEDIFARAKASARQQFDAQREPIKTSLHEAELCWPRLLANAKARADAINDGEKAAYEQLDRKYQRGSYAPRPPPGSNRPPPRPSPGRREGRRSAPQPAQPTIAEIWMQYEAAWTSLPTLANQRHLKWDDIPWPLSTQAASPSDFTVDAVKAFLLSPEHSEGVSPRTRLRNALLR